MGKMIRIFTGGIAFIADVITIYLAIKGQENSNGMEIGIWLYLFTVITLVYALMLLFWYFKDKIKSLKEYRDNEMVRFSNHVNAQQKSFEDRFRILEVALKEKGFDIDITGVNHVDSANALSIEKQDRDYWNEQTVKYNKEFKLWGCPPYGSGKLSTYYQDKFYVNNK